MTRAAALTESDADLRAAGLVGWGEHGLIFQLPGMHDHEEEQPDGTLLVRRCLVVHDTDKDGGGRP